MKNNESSAIVRTESIEEVIYFIRGQKVMLDMDLAMLYGIENKKLLQAVKRNSERFPDDFIFQLTKEEFENLRSQIVTSKTGRGGRRYLPYVFTEQGVAMLSSVLRSPQAIKMNIEIMRTFIKMRHFMVSQKEVIKDIAEIKNYMFKRFNQADREFKRVWNAIEKPLESLKKEERKIGFDLSKHA